MVSGGLSDSTDGPRGGPDYTSVRGDVPCDDAVGADGDAITDVQATEDLGSRSQIDVIPKSRGTTVVHTERHTRMHDAATAGGHLRADDDRAPVRKLQPRAEHVWRNGEPKPDPGLLDAPAHKTRERAPAT